LKKRINYLQTPLRLFLIAVILAILILPISSVKADTNSLYEYQDSGVWDVTLSGATWFAQSFTPVVTFAITSVQLKLYRAGLPGIINVSIRAADGSSLPSGSVYCSGSYDGNSVGLAPEWVEFTFGHGVVLNANTCYTIVCSVPLGVPGDDISWKYATGNLYTRGLTGYSANSGATWAGIGVPGSDFTFRTYGYIQSSSFVFANLVYPIVVTMIIIFLALRSMARQETFELEGFLGTIMVFVIGAAILGVIVVILLNLT
jgi:hypothetical protein